MTLAHRRNLGPTVIRRLAEVGVTDLPTLERLGPPEVYRRLAAVADQRLPLCYYLYSLEGALRDCDWRALSDDEKFRLRRAAGRE